MFASECLPRKPAGVLITGQSGPYTMATAHGHRKTPQAVQ
jgi:hypothetical protein